MLVIDPTYHRTSRRLALLVATFAAMLACAGTAGAADSLAAPSAATLVISGGGYGHGVGMSQEGALGYAEHGWSYSSILTHYYTHTVLGQAPAGAKVHVLIGSTVHTLPLETYVRGVISAEMPSSWPLAALEAQAVAVRTYALTAHAGGSRFDVYSDTRSQVYRGVSAETASTNAATIATAGQIVTYQGAPAITYFFANSGGHTEDVQNAFPGAAPEPWLVGVADPYDQGPLHSWTLSMSFGSAAARLRGLVRGSFRGIEVLKRGASPRIISAAVLGSAGDTQVSGPELAARLGLSSTWAYFGVKRGSRVSAEPDRSGQSPVAGGAAGSRAEGGASPAGPAGGTAPPAPAGPGGGVQGPAGSLGSTPAGGVAAG
jgi:stage II sporulation protein D